MKITVFTILIFLFLSNSSVVDCSKLKFDEEERAYLKTSNNLFNGKCESFHQNGVKAIENNYKNGLLEGVCYMWHPNGKFQLKSQYLSGKRIGKFISFYANGKIESETEYGDNERMLKMIRYKETGEILIKIGE
jgi:antitoxin component YwqK of YwqJK toxin-antitoxin module